MPAHSARAAGRTIFPPACSAEEPSPKPTKTKKATPKKQEPKTEPAARVSKRQWAKIVKKPES